MRVRAQRQGTMVDNLCFEALGSDADKNMETTLGRTPGLAATLAAQNHALPLDRVVNLPEPAPRTRERRQVKLWD